MSYASISTSGGDLGDPGLYGSPQKIQHFFTGVNGSPRHSKEWTGKLSSLEMQIFEVWSPPRAVKRVSKVCIESVYLLCVSISTSGGDRREIVTTARVFWSQSRISLGPCCSVTLKTTSEILMVAVMWFQSFFVSGSIYPFSIYSAFFVSLCVYLCVCISVCVSLRHGVRLRYCAMPRHWLMIAFITFNSIHLVPLLDSLCNSNPCRFEFSIFGVFTIYHQYSQYVRIPSLFAINGICAYMLNALLRSAKINSHTVFYMLAHIPRLYIYTRCCVYLDDRWQDLSLKSLAGARYIHTHYYIHSHALACLSRWQDLCLKSSVSARCIHTHVCI